MTTLPQNCETCMFHKEDDKGTHRCHRHAPGSTTEEFAIALWPEITLTDWCGSGAENDGETCMVTCEKCKFWQFEEGGIDPLYGQGISHAWWEQAGRCRRFSPAPSGFERDRTFWHVTHREAPCGDGKGVDEETEVEHAE